MGILKTGQPSSEVDSFLYEGRNVIMIGRLVNAADINRVANNGETVLSELHTTKGKRYVKHDKTMPISVLPIIKDLKLLRSCWLSFASSIMSPCRLQSNPHRCWCLVTS